MIPYIPPSPGLQKLHIYLGDHSAPPVWTEITNTSGPSEHSLLAGSTSFQSSLTNYPTLTFRVYSKDASFVPAQGTPVKLSHNTWGDLFGGTIQQTVISNIIGTNSVITECQCTSWEQVLANRILGLTGLISPGITENFVGDGSNTSFGLSQLPVAILSIKVNGTNQTFNSDWPPTAQWNWWVDVYVVNQNPSDPPLTSSDHLAIQYDAVTTPSATPPTFSNVTAGYIVQQLVAAISNEGITVVLDDAGPIVDTITFTLQDTVASALSSLCSYLANGTENYQFWIEPSTKILHFGLVGGSASVAPWNLSIADGSAGNALIQLSNTITSEKYANAAIVDVADALGANTIPARFDGDGSATSFSVVYPIGKTPSITRYPGATFPAGGVVQTVGLTGTTGSQWYYDVGGTSITQQAGDPVLAGGAHPDVLDVQFTPLLPQQQVYANTDEIAARQLIEGGSGEHDLYISLSSVLPFALVSGTNLAQSYVDGLKQLSGQIAMATYRGGLKTGQSIQVNIPQIKAVGTYVVDQVTLTDQDRLCLWTVTLITGAAIGDWKTAMKGITGGSALTSSGISTGGGGGGTTGGAVSTVDARILTAASTTITLPTPAHDGDLATGVYQQDSTAGRVISGATANLIVWGTNVKSTTTQIDTTQGTTSIFHWVALGGNWFPLGSPVTGVL
jgi:hypothetical protein